MVTQEIKAKNARKMKIIQLANLSDHKSSSALDLTAW